MRHTRSDISRPLSRIARPAISLRASVALIVAFVAGEACSASDVVNVHGVFLQADDDCRIDNKQTPVHCDQLVQRFRAMHMKSDAWISLFIDNARYETVVNTLDTFQKAGFTNVDVFPPLEGTNLSSKVKRWIRIRVEGIVNHPFAMLLITTEQFRTWREEVLVLSPERYEVIDQFIVTRMLRPDCKDMSTFRLEPPYSNTISLTERNAHQSQACVIPADESCDLMADLLDLPAANWPDPEKQPVMHVRAELDCKDHTRHIS